MCEVACPWTYCVFVGETEHERLGLISPRFLFSLFFMNLLFNSYYFIFVHL